MVSKCLSKKILGINGILKVVPESYEFGEF